MELVQPDVEDDGGFRFKESVHQDSNQPGSCVRCNW